MKRQEEQKRKVFVGMSPKENQNFPTGQAGGLRKSRVFVATYTNEGLKFQMVLGPLKFEPSKRERRPVLPVATI